MSASPEITRPVASEGIGTALVALSAVLWSTAGLFTKAADAGVWMVVFWRAVFSIGLILIYVRWKDGRSLQRCVRMMGWPAWAAVLVGALAGLCFIAAFKHTSIANVATLYACTPFLAALFGWLAWRDRTPRLTLLAAAIALLGVLIMMLGSLGTPSLFGDGLALVMAVALACLMLLIRRYPSEPMVLAACFSGLLTALVSLLFVDPFQVSSRDLAILAGFGVAFAAAHILMTEGARLIAPARTALIGTLETPLAPVWAWLLLSELPPLATWVGGGLVLSALIWNVVAERGGATPPPPGGHLPQVPPSPRRT